MGGITLITLFLILVAIRMPISVCMGIATLAGMWVSGFLNSAYTIPMFMAGNPNAGSFWTALRK